MSKKPPFQNLGFKWWEHVTRNAVLFPRKINDKFMMLSRPSDSGHTPFFYHGVTGTCNGYVYSIGGAILDIDNPSVVKYRCDTFLLTPEEWYEERGFVPNVTFPCATIHDAERLLFIMDVQILT